MKRISYAQNAEDIRLERLFSGQATGFWVDIGAHDPVHFSMTKRFSDRGWTGINVDASPRQYALLAAGRPKDQNLNVGVSDRDGTLTFFEAFDQYAGLSTFSSEEAARHVAAGFPFREVPIPVVTLSRLLDEHAAGRTIDFLSVDVEGHEAASLAGLDLTRHRPRVLVVEATRPLSRECTHDEWEPRVLAHDYRFASFDGLNRWYVRSEDAALAAQLELPMCSHDDYVPWEFQSEIEDLKQKLAAAMSDQPAAVRVASLLRETLSDVPGGLLSVRRFVQSTLGKKR